MRSPERFSWEALILAFGIVSMPIWPNFITLAGLTPPGISIVPLPIVVGDLALSVIAAGAIFIMLARERTDPPPLAKPLIAYVGAWFLAASLGFDPITGFLMVLALSMATAFYFGISAWYARPHVAGAIYATFLATGACVALSGVGMVLLRRPAALYAFVHGRATSTFVVPGEFAGYLLLLIPAAAATAWASDSPLLRRLGIVAASCGIIALGFTYSRAGWLGAGIGAAFFLYSISRIAGKSLPRSALFAALPLVVGTCAGALLFHRNHNPSEDFVRLPIWEAGVRAMELFPLTGTGPGAFRHVYPLLRPMSGEPSAFHVHNVLLTAGAETGVIGVIALGTLWCSFIRLLRVRMREALPISRILSLALATGFTATWAQGMLDFVQIIVLGCWLPFMALALKAAECGIPMGNERKAPGS